MESTRVRCLGQKTYTEVPDYPGTRSVLIPAKHCDYAINKKALRHDADRCLISKITFKTDCNPLSRLNTMEWITKRMHRH